jgi:hypothetical protein
MGCVPQSRASDCGDDHRGQVPGMASQARPQLTSAAGRTLLSRSKNPSRMLAPSSFPQPDHWCCRQTKQAPSLSPTSKRNLPLHINSGLVRNGALAKKARSAHDRFHRCLPVNGSDARRAGMSRKWSCRKFRCACPQVMRDAQFLVCGSTVVPPGPPNESNGLAQGAALAF